MRSNTLARGAGFGLAFAAGLLMVGLAAAQQQDGASAPANTAPVSEAETAPGGSGTAAGGRQTQRLTREGVDVEFSITPLPGQGDGALKHGDFAEIAFRITSQESGEPLRGNYPGVWVDLAKIWKATDRGPITCKERVGMYLQGLVGIRPMVDLTSYYVLSLNWDASISVIDPVVGITGITNLYANIPLDRPGGDWVKTRGEQWMYVTMPRAGKVAVVDLDTFKVKANIAAGDTPTRIALQPDERNIWVGNDAKSGETGGVTVIDTRTREVVASIPTGEGHHEIVFSEDGRYAFVSNRGSGTVSVIDTETREKVRDFETGPTPISLAVSIQSKSLYVADGKSGVVTVIDPASLQILRRIEAKRGIGPMRFSEDGRWLVVANPVVDEVYVIDAATNAIAHTVPIAGTPYQVNVSAAFAYVRALESSRVSMINLTELGKGGNAIVNSFEAGQVVPGKAKEISIADAITPAADEAAVLVVSPGDATIYFYMEGMNAPMGAFRNYGHAPRAVAIANRALKESAPGVYSTTMRVPAAGTFDVAFLNEAPQFLHCFAFEAVPNPMITSDAKPVAVEYLVEGRQVSAGKTVSLRFRLTDPATGLPRTDLEDVRVLYFRAPHFGRRVLPARHLGEGLYEAELAFTAPGAYYVYVGAPTEDVDYQDLNYLTLMAVRQKGS